MKQDDVPKVVSYITGFIHSVCPSKSWQLLLYLDKDRKYEPPCVVRGDVGLRLSIDSTNNVEFPMVLLSGGNVSMAELAKPVLVAFNGKEYQGGQITLLQLIEATFCSKKENIGLQTELCWALGLAIEAFLGVGAWPKPEHLGCRSCRVEQKGVYANASSDVVAANYWRAARCVEPMMVKCSSPLG